MIFGDPFARVRAYKERMAHALVDTELMKALQSGAPGAEDRMVSVWLPTVLRWCDRLGGPRVDSEEAAHDVLLTAIRRIDRVYDAERFPAWLFGITRRTVARMRLRAWYRRWVPGASIERADPNGGPARLYEVSETGKMVHEIMETLPAIEREVLMLCLLEERSDTEAASLLGIPAGTVKSRLRRARENFMRTARARGLAEGVAQ